MIDIATPPTHLTAYDADGVIVGHAEFPAPWFAGASRVVVSCGGRVLADVPVPPVEE